jgi:hypothetical protein
MHGRRWMGAALGFVGALALGCGSDGSGGDPVADAAMDTGAQPDAGVAVPVDMNAILRTVDDDAEAVIVPVAGGGGDPGLDAEGLYLHEFEIIAYHHRPGEAMQNQGWWGTGSNWSYYALLQSGHEAARNLVVRRDEPLDISQYQPEVPSGEVTEEYRDAVGYFDVDVLEVYLSDPGLIYESIYYGTSHPDRGGITHHPLIKYEDLSDIPAYVAGLFLPGLSDLDPIGLWAMRFSILFVRPDWFSTPAVVGYDSSNLSVFESSRPLTAAEEALLADLVGEGTTRRVYDNFIIVPMPHRVRWNMTDVDHGEDGVTSFFFPEFVVSLDLSASIDAVTDFEGIRQAQDDDEVATFDNATIHMCVDGHGVPFGLQVEVQERAAPEDPPSTDAGL